MRTLAKKILAGTPLFAPAKTVYSRYYQIRKTARRKFLAIDRSVTEKYLRSANVKKLHLGCGSHIIDGWLNTDYLPYSEHVVHVDVTRLFPFAADTFDFVFSEHMIEHIPHRDGQHMLNESFRVLKNNGRIRITTPDLAFVIALYQENRTDLQKRYIQWTSESSHERVPYAMDTYVINNFVRDWGHQFIHDEKSMRSSLERAGFKNIVRCNLNESSSAEFRNLENEGKIPPGFLRLESFTMEGTKVT